MKFTKHHFTVGSSIEFDIAAWIKNQTDARIILREVGVKEPSESDLEAFGPLDYRPKQNYGIVLKVLDDHIKVVLSQYEMANILFSEVTRITRREPPEPLNFKARMRKRRSGVKFKAIQTIGKGVKEFAKALLRAAPEQLNAFQESIRPSGAVSKVDERNMVPFKATEADRVPTPIDLGAVDEDPAWLHMSESSVEEGDPNPKLYYITPKSDKGFI